VNVERSVSHFHNIPNFLKMNLGSMLESHLSFCENGFHNLKYQRSIKSDRHTCLYINIQFLLCRCSVWWVRIAKESFYRTRASKMQPVGQM
jgi:hypothetical protein